MRIGRMSVCDGSWCLIINLNYMSEFSNFYRSNLNAYSITKLIMTKLTSLRLQCKVTQS